MLQNGHPLPASTGVAELDGVLGGLFWGDNVLWEASGPLARYNKGCTPSYGNSEGARTTLAARSAVFPGPLMHYAAHLERWRDEGSLAGTRVVREP